MNLLIVLVNYHGADLTIDCLRSLKGELKALPAAHIGLCENGSGEADARRLREAVRSLDLCERVSTTVIYPNRGFTGGNNAVIRPALTRPDPPEYVFLLNNDTLVRQGAIQSLLRFMEDHRDVGIAGSRLEDPDGTSQRSSRRVVTPISEFESNIALGVVSRLLSKWIVAPPERNEPHETGWIPGAAMMIRREVFESVGLLDEDLYTYFDDVDFCLRAKRAGWPTWYVPDSHIVHFIGKTTGVTELQTQPKRRPSYWFLARRHYFLKHFGSAYTALADLAGISGFALWRLRRLIQGKPDRDPPHMMWDLLRHSVFFTGFKKRPVPNPLLNNAKDSRIASCAT